MQKQIDEKKFVKFVENIKKIKTKNATDFLIIDSYINGFIKGKMVGKGECQGCLMVALAIPI